MKLKTFKQYLNEMPLPKDMDKDSLTPSEGEYKQAGPQLSLKKHGDKVGEGSSRVAYHIKVETSQFKDNAEGLDVVDGFANTVIKLALNNKGIAQNEEEIKVYEKYKSNPLLLPIIDTSKQHKINILLADKNVKTASNWIQMPLATQLNFNEFQKQFVKTFGNLKEAILPHIEDEEDREWLDSSVTTIRSSYLQYLFDVTADGKYVNEEQFKNLRYLLNLYNGGLILGDLSRSENWGMFNGKLVILDYGFNMKTGEVYNNRQEATATTDNVGNIILKYKAIK